MKKTVEKYDIVILSPHLDDAVLSLGSHIIKWKGQGKKVKVITVFTEFGGGKKVPRYSMDYLEKSGFMDVSKFEKERIKEDGAAMKMMGVDYENWGFLDAGFRGIYKSREYLLGGKIDPIDNKLIKLMTEKMGKIKTKLLVLPYGVGGHVDHLIVRKVGEGVMCPKNYYLDIPYLWQNFNFVKLFWKIIRAKSIMGGGEKKDEILKCYKSQYGLLVRNKGFFVEIII